MFIFQVHHYIKPDMVEAYLAATLENARLSMQEPGVLRFDVLQDQEDPAHFSLFEVYSDEDAQASHLQTWHFKAWKQVAVAAFERRGNGNQFSVYFSEESTWSKPPARPPAATADELLQAFFDEMQQTCARYETFIQRAEDNGFQSVAKLFRAVVASEKARGRLYRLGMVSHANDPLGFYVCPQCGLVFAEGAPDCCPVDETPAESFEMIR
jgi:(4S)-4-hydroxy-5-phosphonooxypentane-2,3-dione isomerase